MKIPYNKYYQEIDYFGQPYPGLVKFFKAYDERNSVLDLGCGQGRDSLFLASIGFNVLGVDISDVGINQLNDIAMKEQLPVKGIVGDVYSYPILEEIDIILLDSMFHFYKKDLDKEKGLLLRLMDEIKIGGVICNFMQKGIGREKELKNIITDSGITVDIIYEGYTDYPEFNGEFHMYIIKKITE